MDTERAAVPAALGRHGFLRVLGLSVQGRRTASSRFHVCLGGVLSYAALIRHLPSAASVRHTGFGGTKYTMDPIFLSARHFYIRNDGAKTE
jgi:hypothetical protein